MPDKKRSGGTGCDGDLTVSGEKKDPGSDFCVITESPEHRLSNFERLTVVGGDELERAVSRIADQMGSISFDGAIQSFDIQSVESAIAFYSQWKGREAQFFAAPGPLQRVTEVALHGFPDGEVVDVQFASPYQPHRSDFAPVYSSYSDNLTFHARWWRHHKPPRATVVAIHGWTMGEQRLNSLALLPGLFYRRGLDVVIVELPYHGRRRPKGASKEAFLFPGADITLTNETIGQAIADLRAMQALVAARSAAPVGVMGMSLGAYLSVLWSSLDALAFCIPIVPFVSMGEVGWEMVSRSPQFSEASKRGLTLALLEQAFAVHCPLNLRPKVPRERALIVAGIGDRVVPSRQPKLLWDHWRRPQLAWFSGGHAAQMKKAKAFEDIVRFLRYCGYAE